jgi:predicted XRE-type DNA-binding protein
MSEAIYFEESSGNVFADIGVREPEDAALRADLARKITEIIASKGLSQVKVARILGIDRSAQSLKAGWWPDCGIYQ